jgi:hypothetical protein
VNHNRGEQSGTNHRGKEVAQTVQKEVAQIIVEQVAEQEA